MELITINKFLLKIDKISRYLLFALLLSSFVTGFGMVQGLVNTFVAREIHTDWLPMPILLCLLLHGLTHTKITLIRKGVKDSWTLNLYFAAVFATVFGVFFYIAVR